MVQAEVLSGSRRHPRDATGDDGTTLVELTVAMFVIAFGLLSLLPLQVKSAQGVHLAQERQQATALANQALERIRDTALTTAGRTSLAAGGPVYSSAPIWTAPAGETSRTTSTPNGSLAQVGPTAGYPAFTVRVFTTTRAGDPADTMWFTAVTTWQSGDIAAAGRAVSVRTMIYLGG